MKVYKVVAVVFVLVALSVPATAAFAQGPWDPPVLEGTCYDTWFPYNDDLYVWPYTNTFNNAAFVVNSFDGSCGSGVMDYATVVTAATLAEAEDICYTVQPYVYFGMSMGATNINAHMGFSSAPTNLWMCYYIW